MLVPFDVDEDGRIDILVQTQSTNGPPYFQVQTIYNNIFYDSFFIKAMMLSQTEPDPKAKALYGSLTRGASFRYIVTTLQDQKFVQAGVQLATTSY